MSLTRLLDRFAADVEFHEEDHPRRKDGKFRQKMIAQDRALVSSSRWARKLERAGDLKMDNIALDRGSIRAKDVDGRLHVDPTPISKAIINPYLGREIPDPDGTLNLIPDKIYHLLRHPEELKKATKTFNRLPLLIIHKPSMADDHPIKETVGTTGEQAFFDGTYLRNSLAVWTQDAINGIEDNSKRELSCGYRYRADMTPGTWRGVHYDGVMRDIIGNHVALVERGRAGRDVIVGDSASTFSLYDALAAMDRGVSSNNAAATKGKPNMATKKPVLSRKAVVAHGAIAATLAPKLAADASLEDINLPKILSDITDKNFASQKTNIILSIHSATRGKLAQDADLEDVLKAVELVESLEGGALEGSVEVDEADPDIMPNPVEGKKTNPALGNLEVARDFLKSRLSPEDYAQFESILDGSAEPNPPANTEDEDPENKNVKNPLTKAAMDAAISKAKEDAERGAIARYREVRAAERKVEPVVGLLHGAFDSASDVFRAALKMKNVDTSGIKDHVALERMFDLLVTSTAPKPVTRQAMDGTIGNDFATRFPNAGRLKISA